MPGSRGGCGPRESGIDIYGGGAVGEGAVWTTRPRHPWRRAARSSSPVPRAYPGGMMGSLRSRRSSASIVTQDRTSCQARTVERALVFAACASLSACSSANQLASQVPLSGLPQPAKSTAAAGSASDSRDIARSVRDARHDQRSKGMLSSSTHVVPRGRPDHRGTLSSRRAHWGRRDVGILSREARPPRPRARTEVHPTRSPFGAARTRMVLTRRARREPRQERARDRRRGDLRSR